MPGFTRLYALVAVAVLALWLGLLLLGQQARQQRSEHIQALREAYVLRNLRTAAESYLATGLQLPQLEVLQGVVERERQNFAGVMAIDIFSAQGRVLFSTDLGNRGLQVPSAWRELLASDAVWLQTQPGQRQIGQRFEGELGQAVGGIVVTLDATAAAPTLAQWYAWGHEALQWLLVLVLALGVAWWALWLGLRRLAQPYARVATVLQTSATEPACVAGADACALERAAWARYANGVAAHQRCRQAMQQLQELDDGL